MNKAKLNFDANNKTKKNHIVPQVYLRYFKKSNKNDINVYDKKRVKIYTSNISNLSSENKLYIVEDNSKDVYISWEDYYTKNVDNKIKGVFNEILKNAKCTINIKPLWDYELRLKIINIISHQMLRTHEKIYSFYEEYPKELDRIFENEKVKKYKNQEELKKIKKLLEQEYVYKSFALPTTNNVANSSKIKYTLLNKTWTIFCNNTNIDFVTSDTPVVLYDYKRRKASTQNGIANETTLLAYPISPQYMIVIFPNEFLGGAMRIVNNFGKVPCDNVDIIEFYNSLQFKNSYRQIYARRKEELNYLRSPRSE